MRPKKRTQIGEKISVLVVLKYDLDIWLEIGKDNFVVVVKWANLCICHCRCCRIV